MATLGTYHRTLHEAIAATGLTAGKDNANTRALRGIPEEKIGAAGFEPTTTRTPSECATRLRYAPLRPLRARRSAQVSRLTATSAKEVQRGDGPDTP